MSSIAFGSPSRYIQGLGELFRLPLHTEKYAGVVFALIDTYFYEELSRELAERYAAGNQKFFSAPFSGEITKEKIEGYCDQAAEYGAEVIIGVGGGKTLDTAKAVAAHGRALIVVPTSASTDAPTSAMSVIYNDRNEHADVYYYDKNPDLVLVDSSIIAQAPVRFLIAGMGDALATVYEARASVRTGSPNYIDQKTGPYLATRTAREIAEVCGRTILEHGADAKEANALHECNDALESVIEANTLMSGLGFENVGCAASHVICNGISATPEGAGALHGEKVAYGILCQLTAEEEWEELNKIRAFYRTVGLPLHLADMGVPATEENLRIICADTIHTEWSREPFEMNDEKVYQVLRQVEQMGREE
ncbi:MAG: glycerol dehydrogenase [Firmicutes bacterium]|nr:glycerol dehydrogenase [Bacillota bacterium]